MKKYLMVCDESGNCGPNALNKQEPFYVVTGWLIQESKKNESVKIINQILSKRSATELKSTHLMKNKKGQKMAYDLIKNMIEIGNLPVISILEFRFAIVMRIIEFVFSPVYNSFVPDEFEDDIVRKQIFSIILYEIPDELLDAFFKAYRSYDALSIHESLKNIIKYEAFDFVKIDKLLKERFIQEEGNSKKYVNLIRKYLSVDIPELLENCEDQKDTDKSWPNGVLATFNLPMLVILLQTAQNLCEDNDMIISEFVHDQSKEFSTGYLNVFEMFARNSEDFEMNFNDGSKLIISDKYIESDLYFEDSKMNTLVQAADVFAGSLTKCLKDKNILPELYDLIIPFLAACQSPFALCVPRVSPQRQGEIFKLLGDMDNIRSFHSKLKF